MEERRLGASFERVFVNLGRRLRLETIVVVVEADSLALGNRNVWRERRAELGGEELYAQRRLRAIINLSPRRRLGFARFAGTLAGTHPEVRGLAGRNELLEWASC